MAEKVATTYINRKLSPGDVVLGQYKIIKEIARGGMNSIIYLAEDTRVKSDDYFALENKNVAVKIIAKNETVNESDWKKFHEEIETAARISDKKFLNDLNVKNIARFIASGIEDDDQTIIYVMEYINGPSLRKLIEREGYLNLNEAVFFFRHMLMAVRELHRSKDKTIHRDLKPENFLLSKDLTYIKVIDYGISTTFYSKTRGYTKKIVGDEDQIYGTYPYISPDILLMKDAVTEDDKIKIITEQFDFFSLGVIFYEMLIGEKPFYSDNYDDVKVIKLPLTYDMLCLNDLDPNIPNGIENIIFRCMASKKEDKHFRYNTIEEIISDLDKYRSDPSASFNEKLLKPKSMRVFQTKVLFNVQKEKDKQGLFEQLWWIWLVIGIITVTLTIVIVLLIVDKWTS